MVHNKNINYDYKTLAYKGAIVELSDHYGEYVGYTYCECINAFRLFMSKTLGVKNLNVSLLLVVPMVSRFHPLTCASHHCSLKEYGGLH